MPDQNINITTTKAVQTQFREDQRRFTQPNYATKDEDKGGKILAQPAKGTQKQLVGTIIGIIAALSVLVLLKVFHVI